MPAKLYVVPASHPCATVIAALERKGVAYERVDLVPAMHKPVMKAIFGGGTVPGIVFDGARKVHGSRAIVRALEEQRPEPALFPTDAQARRHVVEAEEWGDQVLQPLVRRLVWYALSVDTSAQLSYLGDAKLVPPTPKLLARASGGAVAFLERRFNKVDEFAVRADLAHFGSHLGRIDRWLGQGVLDADGGAPNAADLQIASGVRLLLTLEDLRSLIDERPAGAHARHWFPDYPGRTPSGVFPPAWLRGEPAPAI